MSSYFYGSIEVKSIKLKLILEGLNRLTENQKKTKKFVILGEPGTGRKTMADYIQKIICQDPQMKILFDLSNFHQTEVTQSIYICSEEDWKTQSEKLDNKNNYYLIMMPTLKERKQDLVELAHFFLNVLSLMHGRPKMKLTEKAQEMIQQYGWPGNFHEFESVIESAFHYAVENTNQLVIEPEFLKMQNSVQTVEFSVGMKLEEIERNFILQTLYFVHQNRTKAAEILGISIRTLRNKINQYRQEGFL